MVDVKGKQKTHTMKISTYFLLLTIGVSFCPPVAPQSPSQAPTSSEFTPPVAPPALLNGTTAPLASPSMAPVPIGNPVIEILGFALGIFLGLVALLLAATGRLAEWCVFSIFGRQP